MIKFDVGFIQAQVYFLKEPNNLSVMEMEMAHFSCSYNGTTIAPHWFINNLFYDIGELPPKHKLIKTDNEYAIRIKNVSDDLNGNSYQCKLPISFTIRLESRVGILSVISKLSLIHMTIMKSYTHCV